MRRIFFDETQFVSKINYLKETAKIFTEYVGMYKTLGLGKLEQQEITELICKPESLLKRKTAEKLNTQSSFLGFKIKVDKIYDFVEESPEVLSFLKFHEENIKRLEKHKLLNDFDCKGEKFSLKQSLIEDLEKQNSIYIAPEKEETYDLLIQVADNINKLSKVTNFHGGFVPDTLHNFVSRNLVNGEFFIDPKKFIQLNDYVSPKVL